VTVPTASVSSLISLSLYRSGLYCFPHFAIQ
jgi:hypothetical protein